MNPLRLFLPCLLLSVCLGCSLPPEKPVTREALMQTQIYSTFVIDESPDEVLDALNKEGEVVLSAKRMLRGKEFPVHIKILTTVDGIEVLDYER